MPFEQIALASSCDLLAPTLFPLLPNIIWPDLQGLCAQLLQRWDRSTISDKISLLFSFYKLTFIYPHPSAPLSLLVLPLLVLYHLNTNS